MARKTAAEIMNSPEMKKVMASSAKTLKQTRKAQKAGTVTGNKFSTPASSSRPRNKKSEVVRTTEQLAIGAGYLKGKGRERTKQVKDITDQIK